MASGGWDGRKLKACNSPYQIEVESQRAIGELGGA
jgi:hypothetical protein